ncbi:ankyrin repeat domain-containing protein [Arthrobacter caoxuetaonis]|uniref:Ankyrin repeat domain-containing protein n=1 Tax=Arthrobacter caoxuetaonis TaxID=2886935 RepID=A0A9X1SAW2_9MICC|nr:ankyrin repeat domain-containing protein [Arthrobacter caoxuetaonis]MCC3296518.1 ankyrin repeat domain-containing protein [Arthrobacter caoxuetaonis]USQ56649.1 ankyrin repeat domain-containing protein [Arthrobacter caoxuetaonis]
MTDSPDTAQDGMDADMLELAERLFNAAREGDTGLLRTYVTAGVPATLTNSAGDSLLMLAAYHGHADAVALLVELGADVNTLNDRGQSPLAGAVFKGCADVVRVLAEAGADPDAGNPSARATAAYFQRTDLLSGTA